MHTRVKSALTVLASLLPAMLVMIGALRLALYAISEWVWTIELDGEPIESGVSLWRTVPSFGLLALVSTVTVYLAFAVGLMARDGLGVVGSWSAALSRERIGVLVPGVLYSLLIPVVIYPWPLALDDDMIQAEGLSQAVLFLSLLVSIHQGITRAYRSHVWFYAMSAEEGITAERESRGAYGRALRVFRLTPRIDRLMGGTLWAVCWWLVALLGLIFFAILGGQWYVGAAATGILLPALIALHGWYVRHWSESHEKYGTGGFGYLEPAQ